MKTYIYTLSDETGIRYVGKSDNPNYRFKIHLKECKNSKTRKEKWIQSLLRQNKKPIMEVIDEVDQDDWEFYEKYWICQLRNWGFNLVNGTSGGEGSDGFKNKKHSLEAKKSISKKLKGSAGKAGVLNANSSLSQDLVDQIRYDYDINRIGLRRLVKKYNKPKSTISRVIKRISYR